MATLLGSHFVVETEKSGAPYVVRPTRPRSYLDFEKKKAAARRHYRGLTWLGLACRAGGAPENNRVNLAAKHGAPPLTGTTLGF